MVLQTKIIFRSVPLIKIIHYFIRLESVENYSLYSNWKDSALLLFICDYTCRPSFKSCPIISMPYKYHTTKAQDFLSFIWKITVAFFFRFLQFRSLFCLYFFFSLKYIQYAKHLNEQQTKKTMMNLERQKFIGLLGQCVQCDVACSHPICVFFCLWQIFINISSFCPCHEQNGGL